MPSYSTGGSLVYNLSDQTLQSNKMLSSVNSSQTSQVGANTDRVDQVVNSEGDITTSAVDVTYKSRYKHMLERPFSGYRPRGITNMGATCFMSTVLQVMLHNQDVRTALQMALPFDALGPILLPHSRCMKRDIEDKLRGEIDTGGQAPSAASLVASLGGVDSSQIPREVSSNDGPVNGTKTLSQEMYKEKGPVGSATGFIDHRGGNTVTPSYTDGSISTSTSTAFAPRT